MQNYLLMNQSEITLESETSIVMNQAHIAMELPLQL